MSELSLELCDVSKDFSNSKSPTTRAMDGVSLQVKEAEFFALLGPSGCGKTTTLRIIAGFEQPDQGEVFIQGQAVGGIPSFHRPVNTVFQDYALFPHMTVLQNVMFGLKMAKVPKKEALKRTLDALSLVQLSELAQRKPAQLSGGQQQRIALARALVNQPAVLLLDEPLGALDLKLRKAMQLELKHMQRTLGITFIFVTHDQEEALSMADRIAIMNEGKILQIGKPNEIYESPTNRFVANFIGETNFIDGTLTHIQGNKGVIERQGKRLSAMIKDPNLKPNSTVSLAIRPEQITISPLKDPPPKAEISRLSATILEADYLGTNTRYQLKAESDINLIVRIQNVNHGFAAMMKPGENVYVSWQEKNATLLA